MMPAASIAGRSAAGARRLGELAALELPSRHWQRWVAGILSAAMLVAVLLQFDLGGLAQLEALLPDTPWFWVTVAALYLVLPVSEWVIYRRLWKLPVTGLAALMRKRLSNDLLLGYSGEVYFYAWARQHSEIKAAPFGAIKDVSILSALAANALTLAMLGAMWPWLSVLELGEVGTPAAASIAVILLISIVAIVLGRKIFTLSGAELRFTLSIHGARLLITTALWGLLWHLCLPEVALVYWLVLATLRMLVTRLTFIPNKDLLFATVTMFLIGYDHDVSALMAMTATLMLAINLVVGLALAGGGIFDARRGR